VPVIDGVFVPRSPLTPAEMHVDWAGTNTHVVSQRAKVEAKALPVARRVAVLAARQNGLPSPVLVVSLTDNLVASLDRTARFGAASVLGELNRLRLSRPALAAYSVPDAGKYAAIASKGITAVLALMRQRATEVSHAVSSAAQAAVTEARALDQDPLQAALSAVTRSLHNQVLELVGESLNLSRAAGALTSTSIPEFALRSEQLDRNTCGPCDELHGTIVQVGTPEFYAVMPPVGCLGGGRCRGVYVFGDGPRDVRAPVQIAA
jgi:hypothetical protein